MFSKQHDIGLRGTVIDGLGKGKHFVTLSGYKQQFEAKLGYEPFPGTLNVELSRESVHTRSHLTDVDPIRIDGWTDGSTSYGPVYCYPANVDADGDIYRPTHLVVPERTDHGDESVEMIAPIELRERFDIASGTEVKIHVDRN